MKSADRLAEFVHRALMAGKAHKEVRDALLQAGWPEREVKQAMGAWAEGDFALPVPRPRVNSSAKDVFIHIVLFLALCYSVYSTIDLGMSLVDIWIRVPGQELYVSESRMRWSIATLIVVLPVFLWLNHRRVQGLQAEPAKRGAALRRWFSYITLFLAFLILAGDLAYTIFTLLDGDLTFKFMLKSLLVLVTVGAVFLYYRAEAEDSHAL